MKITDIKKILSEVRMRISTDFSSDLDFFDVEFSNRNSKKLIPAAVLFLIIKRKNGLKVVLTKRSDELKHHPGQVAFPGGKLKLSQESPWLCALREAQEEIGLNPKIVQNIGEIQTHRTITGYEVKPFVGQVLVENVSFLPDEKEVAEIFEVPLEFILAKENMTLHLREIDGKKRGYYAIPYGPYYIWGATARIIKSFSDLIHG
ncbi:MAG: CoA pyrophosphatase [Rhodobacteraceae bacterium]|jgi:8-oxo-dGTP pyrophosphatase MutT (NUDIX family)|nr:MAG: CoA pyrophosphatase [Paracoccaceae bacterium]|tara:strand:+ start:1354 stop:1965 length:612 start_codon:yes stop_codon:yes gene_type:complete